MGALRRATRLEIEQLDTDPEWWNGFLERVTDDGYDALPKVADECCWSWGAFRRWIRESGKEGDFQQALRDFAEHKVIRTSSVASKAKPEDVAVAKLQIDTDFKLAGKLDRKWADKVDVSFAPITIEIVRFGGTVDGSAKEVTDAVTVPA